jgi:hypothetical protein
MVMKCDEHSYVDLKNIKIIRAELNNWSSSGVCKKYMPLRFSVGKIGTLALQYARRVRHEGLEKGDAGEKGFGVFATRPFVKGELICEYEGKVTVSKQEDFTEGTYLYHYQVGKLFYRLIIFSHHP